MLLNGKKKMLNPFKRKRVVRFKHRLHPQIDCHKWANKMETHRLISSKSHVKLIQKSISRTVQ